MTSGKRKQDVESAIDRAYERLLEGYASWGGHNHHGWIDQKDPRSFLGGGIWTEADCVYRYALELEKEFPGSIHFELSLGKATRSDYDAQMDARQKVDIVISDLADFEEDETSLQRFQTRTHEAFIEAKWLKKGKWAHPRWGREPMQRFDAILGDAARLQDNLKRGRCLAAACLIFDDECYFEYHHDPSTWPKDVGLLLVSPCELRRRGFKSPVINAAHARAKELGASSPKIERWKERMTWREGDVDFISPGDPGYGEIDPNLNVDPRTIELIERRKAEHAAEAREKFWRQLGGADDHMKSRKRGRER